MSSLVLRRSSLLLGLAGLAGLVLGAPAFAAAPQFGAAVPDLGAAGQPAQVGNQSVEPTLSIEGKTAVSDSSLAPSSVDLSSPGSFTLGKGSRGFVFQAAGSAARSTPLKLGPSALVFGDAWTGVDLAVRPAALGMQTLELLRSSTAPRSFSWTVSLPSGQSLRQIDDRNVAAVVSAQPPVPPPDVSPDANGLGEPVPRPAPPPDLADSRLAPLSGAAAERPLDADGRVADANLQLSRGIWALNDANNRSGSQVTALIQASWARDANGRAVPTSLSVKGNEITFFSGPGQRRPSFCVVRDRITVDDPRLPPPVGC